MAVTVLVVIFVALLPLGIITLRIMMPLQRRTRPPRSLYQRPKTPPVPLSKKEQKVLIGLKALFICEIIAVPVVVLLLRLSVQ